MRVLTLLVVCAAFGGCIATPTDDLPASVPSQLLVRGFLENGWVTIRLAAFGEEGVQPFQGSVDVILWPEESGAWHPKAWTRTVHAWQFSHDGPLPFYEIKAPLGEARPGDVILLEAEATLKDGRMIDGRHSTVF